MVMSNSPSIWLAESRQPIINAVFAAMEKLKLSKKTSLLILWGGRGAGKTLLLNSIEERIRTSDLNIVTQRWDIEQDTLDEIRARISECSDAAEAEQFRTVLLDNFDLLLRDNPDGDDFFDIERDVILPTVEKGSCCFIITSQIELTQWREDEVRHCQQSYPIPSLSRQETKALSQKIGVDSTNVYDLTFGHPKAIEWLLEEPGLNAEAISIKAFDYFLEGLPPDIQELANQICLMPLFNPYLLRLIASQGNSGPGILYLKHLDQLRVLMGVGLIYWDISVGAYRFRDNAVRRLLARGVQLHDAQLFHYVNETAKQYYQSDARSAGFLHRHLVSAVYHLANTQLAKDDHNIGAICLDWVRGNLTNWSGARWNEVQEMWNSSNHDPALAEEMKDLIGIAFFDAIADYLRRQNR